MVAGTAGCRAPRRTTCGVLAASPQTIWWPGNIRELKHTIEHAVIFCESTRVTNCARCNPPCGILEPPADCRHAAALAFVGWYLMDAGTRRALAWISE
jgi:hypothetical protein